MKRFLTILFLVALFVNCQAQENQSYSGQEDTLRKGSIAKEDIAKTNEPISLDSLWNMLVFDEGGCLTGGQRVRNGRFGNEGCVMSGFRGRPNRWGEFFSYPKSELTPFLVNKFADTTTTRIHTCPCMHARNGEVAVYALQNIYKKNWVELEGFTEHATKESTSCMDIEQIWLWDILENDEQRNALTQQWLKLEAGE